MHARIYCLMVLGFLSACDWNGNGSTDPKETSQPCCGYFTSFNLGQSWVYSIRTANSSCVSTGENSHDIRRSFEIVAKKPTAASYVYTMKIVNEDTMRLCTNPNDPPNYFVWAETLNVDYFEGESGLYSSFPDEKAELYDDNTAISRFQLDSALVFKSKLFGKFGDAPNLKKCLYNDEILDCSYFNSGLARQVKLEKYGLVTDYVVLVSATGSSSWNWNLISINGIEFKGALVDTVKPSPVARADEYKETPEMIQGME